MLGATSFIRFQLTAPLILCEKVEESELKTITPKELPKTLCYRICSGTPRYEKMSKKVGIIIIPPPIPNKPANTPENVPSKK